MALLNYTTTVPVSRSIGQVQGLLVEAGARQVATAYDDVGRAEGLAFTVHTARGPRTFILPVRSSAVLSVLTRDKVPPRYANAAHAERVAWRIVKDWVEAQLAIIRTEMVTLDQVMLPFMQGDDGRTVFDHYVAGVERFALPSGDPLPERLRR